MGQLFTTEVRQPRHPRATPPRDTTRHPTRYRAAPPGHPRRSAISEPRPALHPRPIFLYPGPLLTADELMLLILDGHTTTADISAYSVDRFAAGRLLVGEYPYGDLWR